MKSCIITILWIALALLPAPNGRASYFYAAAAGGGGGPAAFSDDFTGTNSDPWDVAKWDDIAGSSNIQTNAGNFVTGSFAGGANYYSGGTTTTSDQYQRMVFVGVPSSTWVHIGLRYTDSVSPFYTVEVAPGNKEVKLYYYANLSDFVAGTSTELHSVASLDNGIGSAGDVYAVTISGTGASTRVCIWCNPAGGADTPTSDAVWGSDSPDADWTVNPGSPVNTGDRLFLGWYQSAANGMQVDSWRGGDTP